MNSYLFRKDVIFSEEDLTAMNRDFEMHLSTRKILRITGVILLGLLSGNYSFTGLSALLRSVRMSGRIRGHYERFPMDRADFTSWADTAEELRRLVWEHTLKSHKKMINEMSEVDRAELEARIDALIEMQGG